MFKVLIKSSASALAPDCTRRSFSQNIGVGNSKKGILLQSFVFLIVVNQTFFKHLTIT